MSGAALATMARSARSARGELEDGAALGVDHLDLAAPGEGVVAHEAAERREVDAGGEE